MNRRILLVAAGGAAVVVLLAVWALDGRDDGPPAAQAQSPTTIPAASAGNHTITVDGVGSVSGVPDTATVSLGVQIKAPTATEALETAGAKAQSVVDVLTAAGVGKTDIRTTSVYVSPNYNPGGTPNGYWANNSVQATIHDVSKVGPVLDAATRAVGDGVTLGGVSFSIDDTGPLYTQARQKAVAEARTRAGQLAAAANASVGPVVSITESTQSTPPPFIYGASASAATTAPGPVVEPGQQNLQLTVQVVFALMA
jgi:uncharacterized protein YggE